jgi:SAM-dependent methyltransferase
MNVLKKYGVASKDYATLEEARGETYTTKDNSLPPTRLNCEENPYQEELTAAKYILDFGCGVGRNLKWIMENTTATYVGLDPNESMLNNFWGVQQEEYGYDAAIGWASRVILVTDFSQIPDEIKFDYVVSTFVMQHLGYRYIIQGGMNLTEITQNILSRMNNGAIFFAIEHDSEERWIDRWKEENNITLNVFMRSYKGLPELTHRDHSAPNGGHHLMIFKYNKPNYDISNNTII